MMVLLLLAAVLFLTPFISLGSYLQHESVIYGKNNSRKRLFAHLQRLPVSDIQKRDTGEYMILLGSDVDRAYGLLQGHDSAICKRIFRKDVEAENEIWKTLWTSQGAIEIGHIGSKNILALFSNGGCPSILLSIS